MNSSKYSSGLNLTKTTVLVVFDEVSDEEIFQQIIGRANRIGRNDRLEVIKYQEVLLS